MSAGPLSAPVSLFDAGGELASYFWPNTTVLNNKLGIRNRDDLQTQEYQFVAARQAEIELGRVAIAPTYDATHLRTIHRHLFQDLYDWAGEYHTVPLAKGISEFAPANRISSYLDGAAAIVDNTSWPRLPADEFAGTMAKVYAWANHAHPFREGNGRATKLWLTAIASQSPWRIDFERVEADVWNQAAALSGPDRGQLTPDPETSPSRAASTARPRRFRGVNGTQVGRCVTSVGNASGSNRSCCAIRVRGASTWGPMPRAKPATAAQ